MPEFIDYEPGKPPARVITFVCPRCGKLHSDVELKPIGRPLVVRLATNSRTERPEFYIADAVMFEWTVCSEGKGLVFFGETVKIQTADGTVVHQAQMPGIHDGSIIAVDLTVGEAADADPPRSE